jgi:hypothetical protein
MFGDISALWLVGAAALFAVFFAINAKSEKIIFGRGDWLSSRQQYPVSPAISRPVPNVSDILGAFFDW